METKLTIIFITSRNESKFDWFFDSLEKCGGQSCHIVVVDLLHDAAGRFELMSRVSRRFPHVLHVSPKPTIWQGKFRITNKDFWAKSNALNTGICLCNTEWIAMVDDRSVLAQTWMRAVLEAMSGNYAVAGAYEKWANMVVENGVIKSPGRLLGKDDRHGHTNKAIPIHGGALYGCTSAMPVEWALRVNGYPEDADGIGSEDSMFGLLLSNNKFPIRYDKRMKIIEDRTPEELTEVVRRFDKGVSPNDKSNALVARFRHAKTSMNPFDIRQMRKEVLAGSSFPPSTAAHTDWYDNQPVSEMI